MSTPKITQQPSMKRPRSLTVRPLHPGDWSNIEALFGEKGACGGCWCMWWRLPKGGKLWEESKGARNKRAFRKLVTTGQVCGCLAFSEDQPVGWCCVGPRGDFPRLRRTKALQTDWNERTWSVTCFYIPAPWRQRGVASALLKGAVKVARDNGAKELEAYPVRPKTEGARMPAAFAWTGVPHLFEKFKFRNVTPPGNSRDIYRKTFRVSRNR
ncbi:MAG: GNAT family N-acetyltransferase [Phycisphaerales bacterium]|nr:MAG: GNAT family N-acetyltransferase [Phycisphaerales bacterium]